MFRWVGVVRKDDGTYRAWALGADDIATFMSRPVGDDGTDISFGPTQPDSLLAYAFCPPAAACYGGLPAFYFAAGTPDEAITGALAGGKDFPNYPEDGAGALRILHTFINDIGNGQFYCTQVRANARLFANPGMVTTNTGTDSGIVPWDAMAQDLPDPVSLAIAPYYTGFNQFGSAAASGINVDAAMDAMLQPFVDDPASTAVVRWAGVVPDAAGGQFWVWWLGASDMDILTQASDQVTPL